MHSLPTLIVMNQNVRDDLAVTDHPIRELVDDQGVCCLNECTDDAHHFCCATAPREALERLLDYLDSVDVVLPDHVANMPMILSR